jgi:hypothetical protein
VARHHPGDRRLERAVAKAPPVALGWTPKRFGRWTGDMLIAALL